MRRVTLLLVAALLLGALIPVRAHADSGPGCLYEPATMQGFGCNELDFQMIDLKIQLAQAGNSDDTTDWLRIRQEMTELEADAIRAEHSLDGGDHLHVRANVPLDEYQTLDYHRAGENVRFATAVNPDGGMMPRLLFWDALNRPIKVSSLSCTTTAGHYFDVAISLFAGAWAGNSGAAIAGAWEITVPHVIAQGGGALTGLGMAELMGIPDADSCNVLVDVLHTFPNGRQGVYRARLTVYSDGQIVLRPQRWSGLIWWWLGYVSYDSDGNPIW